MKYFLPILLLISLSSNNLLAQSKRQFTVKGKINLDTGTLKLQMIGDSSCYPPNLRQLSAKVLNGQFLFHGNLEMPTAFRISCESPRYVSEWFVVDPGFQSLNCNKDSSAKMPAIKNETMRDDYFHFQDAFKVLKSQNTKLSITVDSLKKIYGRAIPQQIQNALNDKQSKLYNQSDSTLLVFVKQNPKSNFAFWRLVFLMNWGYETIFDSIFNSFSKDITTSYSGNDLATVLRMSANLSIGKKFPNLSLQDISGNKTVLDRSILNTKFTLIDFWYSHCGPCKAQFPDLKVVYAKYKLKGFEIVGISTDQKKYIHDWKNIITESNLNWKQLLDLDGKVAQKLSINAFPSNFLVDEQGNILKKDITPAQLEEYLSKNIR